MWAYDQRSKKCVQFIYGGCKGNGNRFSTIEACERKCVANPNTLA